MKVSKILFMGLIFLVVSIYWSGVPTKGWAEEAVLLAADVSKPATPVKPIESGCKVVQEKDKQGNIIVKLIGPDCEKVKKEGLAKQTKGKLCCECKREFNIEVCRGVGSKPCCTEIFTGQRDGYAK